MGWDVHTHALWASPALRVEQGVERTVGQVMGQGPKFILVPNTKKYRLFQFVKLEFVPEDWKLELLFLSSMPHYFLIYSQ